MLHQERVGRQDNFFALGGHSLRAIQVVARVRDTLGVELPVRGVFESPTLAELGGAIEAARQGQALPLPPIEPLSREGALRLSFAQERLWFLDQLEGPSAIYNIPVALRLGGPLAVGALEQSLGEVVRRHEVLRTTFPTVEGVAGQVIDPVGEVWLPVVDLRELSDEGQGAEVGRLVAEEAGRPFDLARGPLLRVCLLKLGEETHGLLLTLHHIISDGWSMDVFIRELSALYRAFSRGASSPLAALPIQYADYTEWQRRWLSGEVLAGQLAYWQKQLAGAPSLLELPTDHPRPPVQSFRGATVAFALDSELTHALKGLSQRARVTLFMTLLGGFMSLLSRYSGQEDVVVGTAAANRNRRETEGLIGFFVNTLVLRVDLAGNPSFEALLGRVRAVALEAYAHQEVPFERVVEALQPERSLSHSPLFQVAFALQGAPLGDPLGELELPGLSLSPLALDSGVAKFDLSLSMSETDSGLVGEWEYSTDLFERSTIERWGVHFETLLRGIMTKPTQRLADLPLLTEAERQRVVVEWNQTQAPYPRERCIHELFEAQVERTPEAVGVVYEEEHLTYGALNARANQLAHTLQGVGVGPEVLVGICLERSLELVVGLLGVLKAGGAYVPLDPSYPEERLAFMLEDAQAAVLVTQQHLLGTLPLTSAAVICLDRQWESIGRAPEGNPPSLVTPEHLAYVIYTSGSTGRAKGTLLPHRGLCNVSEAQVRTFGLGPGDWVLQFASFSFDASTFEIVMALRSGATLCLGKRENLLPGPALIRLLQDRAITLMTLPPSALAPLPTEALPALRTITVAGEACPAELAAHWAEGRRFFNLYGPTEGTIWSTTEEYRGDGRTLPIGRPLINTQVYLLDPHLQPVPLGVPGELYIGGVGLARGYLQRPELTSEKFLPDPFSGVPGVRVYRTGDLARYLSDGNLEFLGRIDHQVKVRGFRIELGEIEAVLGRHPGVQEACAVVREDHPGEKRLVGYYVAGQGVVEPEALRGYLQGKLPEYMVPGALVGLPALPLTPNGKVDRKALPAPEGRGVAEGYVPPGTPTEELLAGIWAEVLRQERVGRQDNFFALGGHSLVAIQVVSRVRDTFGVELAVRCVFESPTVAELSAAVEAARGEQRPALPPIEPLSREGALRLSFAQERLWFLDHLEGPSAAYNIPGGLYLSGPLDVRALERSLGEIVRRHEVLRTSFPTVEGVAVQRIAPVLEVRLPVVELQGLGAGEREAEVRRLAAEEAQRPFDLARGPLLRVCLVKLGEEDHGLFLTLHHIIIDGWSMGVFVRELSALYQAYATG
ncbi:MAG: amino acid adenylation domain-containing protein, partial [Candidatus Methylomirabilales bacterium]